MIYHFNTLFSGVSIGQYYNACCRIVPDGNWICLWDADVMVFNTFARWNEVMEDVIKNNPDVKLFTCIANRIGTRRQRYENGLDNNPDMGFHRRRSEQIYRTRGTHVDKCAPTISGLMMLFDKSTWEKVGGFVETGILGVDTEFSEAISKRYGKIGIMTGLYVMHYYRLLEGNKDHLFKR